VRIEFEQKRLLALDGGGIRGVITLGVLSRIESTLRERTGERALVLGDWFHYIGGTSTGAIIAAALARGMSVEEIERLYRDLGTKMFKKPFFVKRLWAKYTSEPLVAELKREFGEDTKFGDPGLRCLLMAVLRNATTDSPWPLSNNPNAIFNKQGPDSNLDLPLWQVVRASTAAPTFFAPQEIVIAGKAHQFVDGGVTSFNNPAFQLFLMATLDAYRLRWSTGIERMLLVSVGTGFSPKANANLQQSSMNLAYNATTVPSALMFAALNQQDALCRVFGDCRIGHELELELGDLREERGPLAQKLFTYLRYNVALTRDGLSALGLGEIDPASVIKLDSVAHVDSLERVGAALGESVDASHFAGFA
jgi:patatin-like phospholipase/acyl hydrolase